MSEQRENSGVLFKNNDKTDANKNWPDYKGHGQVSGVDVWISAWIKTGKSGKFMSLAFKPKESAAQAESARHKRETGGDENADIPF